MNNSRIAEIADRIAERLVVASRQPIIRRKPDVVKWFKWLKKNRLDFHMDDDPMDIMWLRPPSPEDLKLIVKNQDKAWDLMDQDELWDVYGDVVGLGRG